MTVYHCTWCSDPTTQPIILHLHTYTYRFCCTAHLQAELDQLRAEALAYYDTEWNAAPPQDPPIL